MKRRSLQLLVILGALAAGLAVGLGTVERPADAAGARAFWIDGVGGATPAETITVYFNPKELTADKSVPCGRSSTRSSTRRP